VLASRGDAAKTVLNSRIAVLVQTSGFGRCKQRTIAFATFSGGCMSQEGGFDSKVGLAVPLLFALETKNSV
tara:strand:+ start:818 stop:1030 length:213 start_codon:yes stop_codon:yes gene_type:complete